jgi:hypothetical protein
MPHNHLNDWSSLDAQMRRYSPHLRDDLRIDAMASNSLATTIAQEWASLPPSTVIDILQSDAVGLPKRLEELGVFQAFMDVVPGNPLGPSVVRAQVITQNYVCFVYLGDSCFKILRKHASPGSTIRKCCCFLTDNPVRAFRNAIAHGNWRYNEDFSGLTFWARKGDLSDEPISEFQVSQLELGFWQALARCVSYVVFTCAAIKD